MSSDSDVLNAEPLFFSKINGDQPLDFGEMQSILGLHVGLANLVIGRHFNNSFADIGLTQKQTSILWLISQNPGARQIDLARTMMMDRPTTLALVNKLEARGLIERHGITGDRRSQGLHITEEGATLLEEAKATVWKHEEWVKGRFTDKELRSFESMLRRFYVDPTE